MWTTKRFLALGLTLLLACFLVACGDDDESAGNGGDNGNDAANSSESSSNGESNDSSNQSGNNSSGDECGDPDRDGVTECDFLGGGTCGAGQYCDPDRLTCSVGCLSHGDCAGDQFCDLGGGAPGACRNCSEYSSGNDDTGNDDTGNNDSANNSSGNNSTSPNFEDGSCEHFCDHLIDLCPDATEADRSECVYECEAYVTSSERECLIESSTCADGANCFEFDDEWDD